MPKECKAKRKSPAARSRGKPRPARKRDPGGPHGAVQRRLGDAGSLALRSFESEHEPDVQRCVRTKMTVGSPDDPLEREANEVARAVTRNSATPTQPKKRDRAAARTLRRLCPKCRAALARAGSGSGQTVRGLTDDLCPECRKKLFRKSGSAGGGPEQIEPHVEAYIARSRGAGQPLPGAMRESMEESFGRDFEAVRVHTGPGAVEANRSLNSRAFATGSDIHLARGESPNDVSLMAHELTHVVQQSPDAHAVRRTGGETDPTPMEVSNGDESILDELLDDVMDAGEAVYDAGAAAVDWLSTTAGNALVDLAAGMGVDVSISSGSIRLRTPRFCPAGSVEFPVELPSWSEDISIPLFAVPIGPTMAITGSVGLTAHAEPSMGLTLGPICIENLDLLIDPTSGNYSISGSVTAPAVAAAAAEVRGGIKGELGVTVLTPIPIEFPGVGVEGGLAGKLELQGGNSVSIAGALGYGSGTILLASSGALTLALQAALSAGAYLDLLVMGESACRIYWEPYSSQWNTGTSLSGAMQLAIRAGSTTIGPTAPFYGMPVTVPQAPIASVLQRQGLKDQCPLIDDLCSWMANNQKFPSQNGGVWDWSPQAPWGPGPAVAALNDPLQARMRAPPRVSGSLCRGACGPNCDTCEHYAIHHETDPVTGQVWEYQNLEVCPSHGGCRQHDAAYDWADDVKGEKGALFKTWHRAADTECACTHGPGKCVGWIYGQPPHDRIMYFADRAAPISSVRSTEGCSIQFPGALICDEQRASRTDVLIEWGRLYGIGEFGECGVVNDYTNASFEPCGGVPGREWHCTAVFRYPSRGEPVGVDLEVEPVTVSILECLCCDVRDNESAQWLEPGVVRDDSMAGDAILELCAMGLIDPVVCGPIEQEMLDRFGNRFFERDIPGMNPDEAATRHRRPEDVPIIQEFKLVYNRLDSWRQFLSVNHPGVDPGIDGCNITGRSSEHPDRQTDLERWIAAIKRHEASYKARFRDARETDLDAIQAEYEQNVRRDALDPMNRCLWAIADWYRGFANRPESPEEIIEEVHRVGTEIWRERWRNAILQVNRILSLLWPPALQRLNLWLGQERRDNPHVDLSGRIGNLDYIGSIAAGFKSPTKQNIRFDPTGFDVDANLVVSPQQSALGRWAAALMNPPPTIKRESIKARDTDIGPMLAFCNDAHARLSQRVEGYDRDDPFDVYIPAIEPPEQTHERQASERLFRARRELNMGAFQNLTRELADSHLLIDEGGRLIVRPDMNAEQFELFKQIVARYMN